MKEGYFRYGKRLLDLILTLPITIVLGIPMLLLAALVRYNHGAPVLFRQARPGLHGRPFTIYKFRTMTDERDNEGHYLPDEKRVTRFGRFLRSNSLDELPELFNVIKGEMSLIGPRPLLMQYLERYTPEQARRHEVKPGITGWAQVNGRNAITWEEKFALDVWYIDNRTMFLDIKILALTMIKIIKREGISHPGYVSAEEFNPQPAGFKADEQMTINPDKQAD